MKNKENILHRIKLLAKAKEHLIYSFELTKDIDVASFSVRGITVEQGNHLSEFEQQFFQFQEQLEDLVNVIATHNNGNWEDGNSSIIFSLSIFSERFNLIKKTEDCKGIEYDCNIRSLGLKTSIVESIHELFDIFNKISNFYDFYYRKSQYNK